MAKKNTTKPKAQWPSECPHKNFFRCKTPKDCPTCFYNKDIKPPTGEPWFYSCKKHAKQRLKNLEDIRLGRGVKPGGKRFPWMYARKINNDEE